MKTILVCFALLVAAGSLHAVEPPPSKLSQFTLGPHLAGPKITLADVTGKAVLIYAWGYDGGRWLKSLADVESISKRYKDKMLVFGAQMRDGTDGEIIEIVRKRRLTFTITKGLNSPLIFSTVPRALVFDTTGLLIFIGEETDAEFERSLRKATQGAAVKPSGLDALKRPGS